MTTAAYARKIEGNRRRGVEESRTGRDIADGYPPPGDLATRAACERDFRLFCETYFPNAFNLGWSEDHLRVIARMEEVILGGGLFALAMPRGSGKSTLSIRAAVWALLYGHRRFVCLVGATEPRAKDLLKQIKTELIFNERLAGDFRQVCYPLQRLENNGRKAIGQLFEGEQTRIDWSDGRLTFPTMPDSACDGVNVSGYAVSVAGLTGSLRGQMHTLPSGLIIRPEVAIVDDPQTRASAMSASQSNTRVAIVKGDVLGMAGPAQQISVFMPCTVIRDGDLASEMLDRVKNPEWCGQLTKMVYSFPADEKLWEQYWEIRSEDMAAERGHARSNEFYRERREAMDAGAVVAWESRFNKNEVSAVQNAMNLKFMDERAFFAEYQNEPLPEVQPTSDVQTADEIAAKVNRVERGSVPVGCTRVTAFVDVHLSVLYYSVVAWEDDFTGYVIDYGTFPDQKRAYFTLRDSKNTLETATKAAAAEGRIYAGLGAIGESVLGREWRREDGAVLRIERCLIDANYGDQTDVVYKFCRESPHASVLTPSHGKGIGASGTPMRDYTRRPGERAGMNWIQPMAGARVVRKVIFDTNFWKTFLHARLATAMGDKGCLSLFGDKPAAHRMYADHMTAEYPVSTTREGTGRTVNEWKVRSGHPDNHYFDTLVGCAVAASMQGVQLAETTAAAAGPKRPRMTMAEMRARRGA